MDLPEQTIDDLLKRLRRIEGQVRGIQQMLTDRRECRDVVTQISAASKALDQAGFKLVASGLTYCLNNPERAARVGAQLVAGTLWVNCFFVRDLRAPFGGSRHSGVGREGGTWSFDFYCDVKNTCTDQDRWTIGR